MGPSLHKLSASTTLNFLQSLNSIIQYFQLYRVPHTHLSLHHIYFPCISTLLFQYNEVCFLFTFVLFCFRPTWLGNYKVHSVVANHEPSCDLALKVTTQSLYALEVGSRHQALNVRRDQSWQTRTQPTNAFAPCLTYPCQKLDCSPTQSSQGLSRIDVLMVKNYYYLTLLEDVHCSRIDVLMVK